MKPYSLDMRQKIVNTYEAGNTYVRKVAERFQVSKSTAQELLKLKIETGKLLHRQAKGGKPSQLFGKTQSNRFSVIKFDSIGIEMNVRLSKTENIFPLFFKIPENSVPIYPIIKIVATRGKMVRSLTDTHRITNRN